MIRVVLDTNVLVSAYLNENGLEAKVLMMALRGDLVICVSEPILSEYEGVLRRKKFPIDPTRVGDLLRALHRAGHVIQPLRRLAVSSDAADNRFLECAEAASADFLVPGNKRHFPKQWRKTKVVNARELLEIIGPELMPFPGGGLPE